MGLSNLENVLQRNLRTERARESIFRVSGGTTFKVALLDTNPGDTFVTLTVRLVCRCIQKSSGCVTEMGENFDKYSFILRKKMNVPKVFLLSVEREAQFP